MIFPQEIIGAIVSFLSSKEAFNKIGVSRHWMNSILHTQHKISIDCLSHGDSFGSTMNFVNFVTDIKLGNCKEMREVNLAFLEKMKKTLRSLTIDKHGLGSVVLKDFPLLEYLQINNSSELHTVELKNVPKLKILDLTKTGIINGTKVLNFIDENSRLEKISFSGCSNIFYDLKFPCPVDSLLTLDISHTMIHASILEQIVKDCPNLTSLIVNKCTQLKRVLIRDHMNLKYLTMHFCRGLYEVKILGNSSLTQLDLSSNAVYGKFLAGVLRANPSLTHVDYSNCFHMNELSEGFEEISLPDLVDLNCDFTTLRDEHVKTLMNVCSGLKVLKLKQTEIFNLLDCGSSTIETLDISGTSVTHIGVNEVLQKCLSLKDLNVRTCQCLRDGQLDFGKARKGLEVFSIGNTVLSQHTVYEAIRAFPNLRVIDMSRIKLQDKNRVLEIKNAYKLEKLDCTGNNQIERFILENCPLLVDLDMTECHRMVNWEFKGEIGFSNGNVLTAGKEKKVMVSQCREDFMVFLETEYSAVKIIGRERTFEKSSTYQQLNFQRCVERNKAREEKLKNDGML